MIVAGNGQEALVCLEDVRPDLILSDIMMPVMDGRELCRKLRAHPEYRSIPVVLMSAAHSASKLADCRPAAFLRKPFAFDELLATVARVATMNKTRGEGLEGS